MEGGENEEERRVSEKPEGLLSKRVTRLCPVRVGWLRQLGRSRSAVKASGCAVMLTCEFTTSRG